MIIKNANPIKLSDELTKNSIKFYMTDDARIGESVAENITITFSENADMELVQQIIDAHDPTPLPKPNTELEILQETVDILVLSSLEVL